MKANKCPICENAMPAPWMEYPQYPFCSKRCKLIDLGRWLGEDYKIEKKDDRSQSSDDGTSRDEASGSR